MDTARQKKNLNIDTRGGGVLVKARCPGGSLFQWCRPFVLRLLADKIYGKKGRKFNQRTKKKPDR